MYRRFYSAGARAAGHPVLLSGALASLMRHVLLTLLVCAAVSVTGIAFIRGASVPLSLARIPHGRPDLAGRVVVAGWHGGDHGGHGGH